MAPEDEVGVANPDDAKTTAADRSAAIRESAL